MFVNANNFYIPKNKWRNQQIHKKNNKIQYASKHYGLSDNYIILKPKHPMKQRKDRKQFKAQRRRKKIYKQMSFDFDDFLCVDKNENYKRIQIRPTIQYQYHCNNQYNINAIYNNYYKPKEDDIYYKGSNSKKNKKKKKYIDGITVKIKFYQSLKSHELIQSVSSTVYVHDNKRFMFPVQTKTHSLSDSAINNLKYVPLSAVGCTLKYLYDDLYDEFPKLEYEARIIADNALECCQKIIKNKNKNYTLPEFSRTIYRIWDIWYPEFDNNIIYLYHVFCTHIGYLWFIFNDLYEYIGYKSLMMYSVKAQSFASRKRSKHIKVKNSNNGIKYYNKSKTNCYYDGNKYIDHDYIRKIKSYIPSYIYYKQNNDMNSNENKFYNIGEYNDKDWNIVTYFCQKKGGRIPYNKTKEYLANKR